MDQTPNLPTPPPPRPVPPEDAIWADAPDGEGTPALAPFESDAERGSSGGSTGGFAFILVAVLVLVAGVVYVLGARSQAEEETAVAEQQARSTLNEFDPDEFTSELADGGSSPDELALTDDEPAAAPTTTAAPAADAGTGEAEGPTSTVFGGPGREIDPADIVLAFVNRIPGNDYGTVGYLDANGERHFTDLRCVRLDLNENGGICLTADGGLAGSARGYITDASLNPTKRFPLNRPSRAAVSPDGAVVAWTGFTVGHSYLAEGEFATITQLISVERSLGANLETEFRTRWNGDIFDTPDRNYWGVTFVDSDHFYATMGSGGETVIVEGRISNSSLEVVFENASCPEVSADGSTIVAKELRGDSTFQLVAIDTATGDRFDLGETRSVDDQVEWLDSDTILYALPNGDEGTDAQPALDIWAIDVVPGAEPRLVVPLADSPAA